MTIGRICCREVDTANPDEPVRNAAQRMGTRAVGTLVVSDEKNRVIGILTDRDIAVRVVGAGRDAASTVVSEVMSEIVQTGFEDMPIEDALRLMRAEAVRRLVVVRRDGTLAGIVSLDDILKLLADEMREVRRLLQAEDPRQVVVSS